MNFNTDSEFVREIENMCAAFVTGLGRIGLKCDPGPEAVTIPRLDTSCTWRAV